MMLANCLFTTLPTISRKHELYVPEITILLNSIETRRNLFLLLSRKNMTNI